MQQRAKPEEDIASPETASYDLENGEKLFTSNESGANAGARAGHLGAATNGTATVAAPRMSDKKHDDGRSRNAQQQNGENESQTDTKKIVKKKKSKSWKSWWANFRWRRIYWVGVVLSLVLGWNFYRFDLLRRRRRNARQFVVDDRLGSTTPPPSLLFELLQKNSSPSVRDVLLKAWRPKPKPNDKRRKNKPKFMPTIPLMKPDHAIKKMTEEWERKDDRTALRYWDTKAFEQGYVKPRPPFEEEKFLSVEWYDGGFNNVRMSLEMAFVLAYMLNRTLVIPNGVVVDHRNYHQLIDFTEYWDLDGLKAFVPTISFSDFTTLIRQDAFPETHNHTQVRFFNPASTTAAYKHDEWNEYSIETIALISSYKMWEHHLCIPDCPSPATHSPEEMKYFNGYRSPALGLRLITMKKHLENNTPKIIHFPQVLFSSFYRSVYLEPKRMRPLITRKVRDHIRFRKETMAWASIYVEHLGGLNNFHCMHVRSGNDWLNRRKTVKELWENTKELFPDDKTVYVSANFKTWDKDNIHRFDEYAELSKKKVVYWDLSVFEKAGVPPPPPFLIPNVESLVCAAGQTIAVSMCSTFSVYISRLHGYFEKWGGSDPNTYMVDNRNTKGQHFFIPHNDGNVVPSWDKNGQTSGATWCVEWREAWRDLKRRRQLLSMEMAEYHDFRVRR